MSSGDSNLNYYNNKIFNANNQINACTQRIKELETDISELKSIKTKVTKVQSAIDSASESTVRNINDLPNLIFKSFSVLKLSFFSSFISAIKGTEYSKANNSILAAKEKIEKQINKCYQEIDELKGKISSLQSSIRSLERQKANYINQKKQNNK